MDHTFFVMCEACHKIGLLIIDDQVVFIRSLSEGKQAIAYALKKEWIGYHEMMVLTFQVKLSGLPHRQKRKLIENNAPIMHTALLEQLLEPHQTLIHKKFHPCTLTSCG